MSVKRGANPALVCFCRTGKLHVLVYNHMASLTSTLLTPLKLILRPTNFSSTAANASSGVTLAVPRNIHNHSILLPADNAFGALMNDGAGSLRWQNFVTSSVGVQVVSVTDGSKTGTIQMRQFGAGSVSLSFRTPLETYSLGIDPDDSSIFKLSHDSNLGVNDIIKFTANSLLLTANMGMPATNVAGTAGVFNIGTCTFYAPATNNLFIGSGAGNLAAAAAEFNTAIGRLTLSTITDGTSNTAFGDSAAPVLTIGSDNTAIGYQTLLLSSDASRNTAVGSHAMANGAVHCLNDTAIGYNALISVTGDRNTAVGAYAGTGVVAGTDVTCLGYSANVSSPVVINATAVGSGASVAASNRVQLGNTSVTSIGFGSTALTTNQIKQLTNLPNVPTVLIQSAMWTSLIGLNQPVSTSSSPTFANLTVTGTLNAGTVGTTTIQSSVRTITGALTSLNATYSIIKADASGNPIVLNLPASGLYTSIEYKIYKSDAGANTVTIARAGANTIGYVLTSFVLTMQGEFVHLIDAGDGNWLIK